MARGQAFETMMLVISVIVALAILGVLLQILGIVKIFNPSDPVGTMQKDLKSVQNRGYGIMTPVKITLTEGTTIDTQTLISDIPILATDVKFVCKDDQVCGGALEVSSTSKGGTDSRLSVRDKIEVNVVVCGDVNSDAEKKFCIALARSARDATDHCDQECLGA